MQTTEILHYPWNSFDLSRWRDSDSMWLSFDADSGGIQVFSCPMRFVKATESVLLQLASDLEFVVWNMPVKRDQHEPSDEAEFYLMPKAEGARVPGFLNEERGRFFCQCWMCNDIWERNLAQEVLDVISGRMPRLNPTE